MEGKKEDNMKIKVFSVIFALLVLLSVATFGASANSDEIALYWQNTGSVSCKIGFSDDGYGYAEAHVMGHPTTNKITAEVYVYRQVGSSWVYVGEEHKTVNSNSLTLSCKFNSMKGAYYRADYTFVVTKNSVNETITKTTYKTCS